MAWPGSDVATTAFDDAGNQISDARRGLEAAVAALNEIIAARGRAGGVAALDAAGKAGGLPDFARGVELVGGEVRHAGGRLAAGTYGAARRALQRLTVDQYGHVIDAVLADNPDGITGVEVEALIDQLVEPWAQTGGGNIPVDQLGNLDVGNTFSTEADWRRFIQGDLTHPTRDQDQYSGGAIPEWVWRDGQRLPSSQFPPREARLVKGGIAFGVPTFDNGVTWGEYLMLPPDYIFEIMSTFGGRTWANTAAALAELPPGLPVDGEGYRNTEAAMDALPPQRMVTVIESAAEVQRSLAQTTEWRDYPAPLTFIGYEKLERTFDVEVLGLAFAYEVRGSFRISNPIGYLGRRVQLRAVINREAEAHVPWFLIKG